MKEIRIGKIKNVFEYAGKKHNVIFFSFNDMLNSIENKRKYFELRFSVSSSNISLLNKICDNDGVTFQISKSQWHGYNSYSGHIINLITDFDKIIEKLSKYEEFEFKIKTIKEIEALYVLDVL
jgi:AAA+ superfamily predicted ATPase